MVDDPRRGGEVPAGELDDDELTRALRLALDDQLGDGIDTPPQRVEAPPPVPVQQAAPPPPPAAPPAEPAATWAPPAPGAAPPAASPPPAPAPAPAPDPEPGAFAELDLGPELRVPAARLATQLSRLTVAVVATRETLRRVTERLDQGTVPPPISLDDVRDIVEAAVADGFAPLTYQIERLRSQVEALTTPAPAAPARADDGWFDDDDEAEG